MLLQRMLHIALLRESQKTFIATLCPDLNYIKPYRIQAIR